MTDKYCMQCGRDIFGFKQSEINPKEASGILLRKNEILKEAIG